MVAFIQKHKFCKQVQAKHLNHLAQTKNENKVIQEEAKAKIRAREEPPYCGWG